jgi:putative ABC transport system substrate-binding protein
MRFSDGHAPRSCTAGPGNGLKIERGLISMNPNKLNARRQLLGALLASGLAPAALAQAVGAAPAKRSASASRPLRIYGITFRGITDVERGFEEYFSSRKIPVQITWRDLNRDATRMAGFIEEIRATRPDVIYTWGTSVTLGVIGPYDAVDPAKHITDIPVVFTLVAAPALAKIVPDGGTRKNVSGVVHVAPVAAQIQAMAAYRPYQKLGVLYTPTERNSVVVLDEIRKLGRERNYDTITRTFRLDAQRKVTAEGAADLVRELKDAGSQWLYLPPDSFLGTLAQDVIIPTAMEVGLPTFASTEQLMQAGALSGLVSRYHSVGQFTAQGRADLGGEDGTRGGADRDAEALLLPDPHQRGREAEAAAAAADVQLRRDPERRARRPITAGVRPANAADPALPVRWRALQAAWPRDAAIPQPVQADAGRLGAAGLGPLGGAAKPLRGWVISLPHPPPPAPSC